MKILKNVHSFSFSLSKVNKLLTLVIIALLCVGMTWSQNATGYGIKGGLNYNGNGDYIESIGSAAEDPDKNVGFHIGVFGKFGRRVYFKPELVYTNTKSSYDSGDFKMQKLDAPLLVGLKIIGPLSVFAGPSFQYIIDTEFEDLKISDIENDISMGLNFGVGVNINKIGIDLRYERGFSENEATFLTDNGLSTGMLDTRPEQLILSVSLIL